MMDEKQLYLFVPKGDRRKIRKRHIFTLHLDSSILIGALVVLLFVLSFSLGINRGKKLSQYNYPEKTPSIRRPLQIEITRQVKSEVPQATGKFKVFTNEKVKKEIIAENDGTIYVIQVASYAKENFAKKEARELEQVGYPVIVTKKGNYLAIFVGEFKTKQEAKESLKPLKEKYKDCFVRRL